MKVTIDGKEYECKRVVMDNDNVEILLEEDSKKETGYERVGTGVNYYLATNRNEILVLPESNCDLDCDYYDNANYYSSEEIAKNNTRADRLMRQLRRFSVENRKNDINWIGNKECGYRIVYNHQKSIIEISCSFIVENFGTIYFDSQELARRAIKEFKDELIWYFTEYKDSL